MFVHQLKTLKVHACHEGDPALACARLMRREKVGFVPVLNAEEEVVGVVTDRDLVIRLVASDLPLDTPVREVMTVEPLLFVYPDDTLNWLEEKMAIERKSRAIVLDHSGVLLGVVSLSDVAGAEPSETVTAQLLRDITSRESAVSVLGS